MKSFRQFNLHLYETAAPGQEKFIKDSKEAFKKRYGKDWERILYATAWKRHDQEMKEETTSHIDFKYMGNEYRVSRDGSVVEAKDKKGWHRTYALNILELAKRALQRHSGGQ